jgi:hypothetical protein
MPTYWHRIGRRDTSERDAAWELVYTMARQYNKQTARSKNWTWKQNPHCNLNRRQQVTVTRLRTGHSSLTHSHVLVKGNPRACNTRDTYIHHYKARPDWLTAVKPPQQDKTTEFRRICKQHSTTDACGSRLYSSWKSLACVTGYDTLLTQSSRDWFVTP